LGRPEAHGVLNGGKDLAVLTMDDQSGGYDFSIFQKRSGAAFTANDMVGTWHMCLLDAGYPNGSESYEWYAWGTLTIDASGAVTGEISATGDSAERKIQIDRIASITTDGVVTFADDPSAHGTMSDDKDFIVVAENGGDGECRW
jgi:hypothetical protein